MIRRLCTIKKSLLLLTGLAVLLWAAGGWAQEASVPSATAPVVQEVAPAAVPAPPKIDTGDTAWV